MTKNNIYTLITTSFTAICLFSSTTCATQTVRLTEAQRISIKKETCDKVSTAFGDSTFSTILNISDSLKGSILAHLADSQFVVVQSPYIVNISDCELELFTDSVTFNAIKANLASNNFTKSNNRITGAIPRVIDFTSTTVMPRNFDNMEETILEEYLKNNLCIGLIDSHLTVKTAGLTIHNAKCIWINIRAQKYKKLKQ